MSETRSRASFWAVLSAHGISLTGNAMTLLAVPWFVLTLTDSPTRTGLTAAAAFLPVVLSLTLGGAVADRVGHGRTSVACDLVSAGMIGLIPLLHLAGLLSFPLLLALVFLAGLFDTPGNMARQAMIPTLAERAGMPIEQATSMLGIVERSARLVGAPLAGLLIVALGPLNVLVIDAVTFAVSALIVGVVRVRPSAAARTGASYFSDLKEGFVFVWRDPLLRNIALLLSVTNVLDVAYGSVVIPIYADRVLSGAGAAGLLIGTSAVMAVLGGLVFGTVARRLPRWQLFTVVFAMVGLPRCVALALEPGIVVLLVVTAFSGFCAGMVNPILSSATYERTPEQLRARVLGAVVSGAFALVALGPVLGGMLIGWLGVRSTLVVFAVVYGTASLSLLLVPAWRSIGTPPRAVASVDRRDPVETTG